MLRLPGLICTREPHAVPIPDRLSARSRRLWPQHPRSALAGRGPRRSAIRGEFRGGRRELDPVWRSGLGGVPLRRARRAALARPASYERGIDVRIRLPRRLLAAVADFHRAQSCGDRVRHGGRATPQSASGHRHARGRLGDRLPWPEMDRLQGFHPRRRSRAYARGDQRCTPRRPASGRSAGIPGGRRRTRSVSSWPRAAFSIRRIPMPTTCPIGCADPTRYRT